MPYKSAEICSDIQPYSWVGNTGCKKLLRSIVYIYIYINFFQESILKRTCLTVRAGDLERPNYRPTSQLHKKNGSHGDVRIRTT